MTMQCYGMQYNGKDLCCFFLGVVLRFQCSVRIAYFPTTSLIRIAHYFARSLLLGVTCEIANATQTWTNEKQWNEVQKMGT
jgi:hypothetical protein